MAESEGQSGFGTTLSGASTGTIAFIQKINLSGQEVNDIDVSTMESPEGWREFVSGMKDAKEISCDCLYTGSQMATLLAALGSAKEAWTITFPEGSTFVCDGYIKGLGEPIPMDDKITQTVTIKLTGKPTFTASS